jgi:hypothetical protein
VSILRTVAAARALIPAGGLLALAALGLAACGGGQGRSPRGSGAARVTRTVAAGEPRHAIADFDGDDHEAGSDADDDDSSPPHDRDGDSDGQAGQLYDSDNADVLAGRPASTSDLYAVKPLVHRYFAAIARLDGRTACSLMLARVADHVPEVLGSGALRPSFVHGGTCPQIAASVFAFYGHQLRAEAGAVEVTALRVRGASGLAVLAFRRDPSLPLRVIELGREGDGWRVDGMLDNELA